MNERTIRVWDLPTRIFHWLLLALVTGSIVSVKIGGNAMIWHGRFGHLIVGLIVFRIVWGFVGSTHARFVRFVPGPGAIRAYLGGRWRGVGHNPLGALSVLALLGAIGFQAVGGLFANDDIAFNGPLYRAVSSATSNQISGWHRQGEWVIFALIALHVGAVLFYALVRKERIILPMITGCKVVRDPAAEPARGGGWLALAIALAIAGLALWVAGGGLLAPPPPPAPDPGW
jgi:cytochrome b